MFEANFIKSGKLIPRCLDPTETIFPPEMKRVSVLNRSLVTVPESEKKKLSVAGERRDRYTLAVKKIKKQIAVLRRWAPKSREVDVDVHSLFSAFS